jgi:hypothetical protein
MLRLYPVNVSAVDASNAMQVLIPAITEAMDGITPDIFVCSLNSDYFPRKFSLSFHLSENLFVSLCIF